MLPDSTFNDIKNLVPADHEFCHAISHAFWGDHLLLGKKERKGFAWDLFCLKSVTSTMDFARWLCREDAKSLVLSRMSALHDPHTERKRGNHPAIIVTEEQTRGRGRKGRTWESTTRGGVYLTFLLFPEIPPRRLVGLSLVIGLAVLEGLKSFGVNVQLKWPNDILAIPEGQKAPLKLGGILTELITTDENEFALSIGVGINITKSEKISRVGGIALEEFVVWEIPYFDLLRAISEQVISHLQKFLQGGFKVFSETWLKASIMQGRRVQVMLEGVQYEAHVTGVSDEGGLIVKPCDGHKDSVTVYAGDIKLLGEK